MARTKIMDHKMNLVTWLTVWLHLYSQPYNYNNKKVKSCIKTYKYNKEVISLVHYTVHTFCTHTSFFGSKT
jgi:hypothetical protein